MASHYLTQGSCFFWLITCLDSQGGLEIYSQSSVLFFGNIKTILLLASARALAAGFVDSHKLMTTGTQSRGSSPVTDVSFYITHGVFVACACILFIALLVSRNTWLAFAARCVISFYSIIVGVQVVVSTLKVRRVLVEENSRTGKYVEGIRKLNRLAISVVILLIVGNTSLFIGFSGAVSLALSQSQLVETPRPFSYFHIFSDFTGLIAPAALIMGAWNVGRGKGQKRSSSRKSTALSTETSKRLAAEAGTAENCLSTVDSKEAVIEMSSQEEVLEVGSA